MLRVRRRPRRWNLPACLHVDLLRERIFSRSLDEVTLTITREIAPVHPKPTGVTAVRWSQGSMPRKYATHDTYSLIFPVHKLRQTELTKDIRSKWRLWPLRPAVCCTRGGADWPKVVAVGAQQPISDFFWLYSNARHTTNIRRTSPGSWSQELSSHTKINEIRQWRPKWRQFKKVVSLAGAHHTCQSVARFFSFWSGNAGGIARELFAILPVASSSQRSMKHTSDRQWRRRYGVCCWLRMKPAINTTLDSRQKPIAVWNKFTEDESNTPH